MIDHHSIKDFEEISKDETIILKMEDIPEYDIEDYDLMDKKDRANYIKDLEKIVRGSFEYRQFIQYLRENMNMDSCAFLENVSNKETFKVKIELHHTPFTLYDICTIVLNRRLSLNLPTDIEMVAKEVVGLHYYLFIGLIPLSETVHKLVHNQYLFVPLTNVLGNYPAFVEMYNDYIPPDLLETYENNLEYSEKNREELNLNILEEKHTYIDSSSLYQLPTYSSVVDSMYGRIEEIKQLSSPLKEENNNSEENKEAKEVTPGIIWD